MSLGAHDTWKCHNVSLALVTYLGMAADGKVVLSSDAVAEVVHLTHSFGSVYVVIRLT